MDLYEASENGNEERVVELLVFGKLSPASQLRARGIAGRTALLAACLGGQSSVVRLLLGKKCIVHFTSRTEDEVVEMLKPLVEMLQPIPDSDSLFKVSMVTKDGSSGVVPMAVVQLPPQWAIPPSDLLEGKQHVDHFGNTPLQCVSCFGCGSSVKHIDDGLDMTRQLLIHGDQPNLPKKSNKWTPLHWAAYNGNHEQIKMLLDPVLHVGDGTRRFAKTQIAIPLLIDTDDLFAVDIAGRRGLALEDERATLQRQLNSEDCDGANGEYAHWRLRLDHIEAVRLFIHEFLANGAHLTRYVAEMNARNPLHFQKNRSRSVTAQDVVRYGQHLLYWAGCFGLVSEVRSLLQLELKMTGVGGSSSPGKAAVKPLVARSMDDSSLDISLRMLYTCSCEYGKRQSVLHAVAAHGQVEILRLFLAKMLDNQLHPSDFSSPVGNSMTSFLRKAARPRKPVVVPISDPTEMTDSSAESGKYTDQLNILEHVNTGWTNYRNETPLFHAVLYLQESAVRFFANVLCSTSLAWELANVNVEGSLLHHICSEISRHTLGIEHQSARPEYVMLFDGVKRKQFKETVIETMHEESSIAPSLVVTRSGVRDTVSEICKAMGEIDYLVIGATDEVLIQQAQRLQLKVKHRGSSTRSMYSASSPELFESFRSLQRQQVILSIIQRKIDLQKHIKNGNIQTIFPLHDVMGCRNIIRQWGYTDSSQRIFQPFAGNSLEQFFLERKRHQYEMLWPLLTYFGEKHAFYYAFVTFYTAWLLPIALVGMACQMLWLANNVSFVPPLFGIVVSIWATLMVERWKRKRSEIQRKFGHFRRNRSEGTPGFYGDFLVETAMIRAKRAVDVSFPRAVQLVRIYTGIPLLLTMAVAAVVIFVAVKTNSASSAVVHNAMPRLPVVLVPYVVPFINAVSMLLLDNWYTRLARSLTTWENHRTVWEFESMLATKLFSFKFLNAFISLFWIAFVDQNATALRKQLLIIMGTRQLWNSIQRDVLPMFHVRLRWKQAGFRFQQPSTRARKYCWSMSSHEWYDAELSHPLTSTSLRGVERPSPPPMILLQELMYPHDFLMGKQMEVVLQFGYVTMFVSVLPVAPLFALLSNVVAMRLDVLSCTQTKRRPPFESETEVSTFTSILEFMSFAAVAVNCAVLFFTTRSDLESLIQVVRPSWRAEESMTDNSSAYVTELWLLLVVEHVVLGTKALLSLVIDDSASWVRLDEDQTDEEEKKRMLGMNTPENVSTTRRSTEELETMQRRDRVDQSKFNQVLAKQYIAALGERDEALKREQTARRLLAESMKYAEQAHAQTVVAPGLNDSLVTDLTPCDSNSGRVSKLTIEDERNVAFRAQANSSTEVGRRLCFICFALRNLQIPAGKRCLSCHIALCPTCDGVVHLDDLGVREPQHFRVKVSVDMPFKSILGEGQNVVKEEPDKPDKSTRRCSRHEKKQLRELRRHVESFISYCGLSRGQQRLTCDEAFKRCCASVRIALRYLRNYEQQRLYLHSSNPTLAPVTTEL
ncbi:Calcium-activated chloride channel [Phytophthora infestans]|uniref:Calcium-activated chloride channel n=1 Tax=Phytophthora infestans TaxID=4787 RepID=A0A833T5H3_PHYIN|nr:Calcium-activated chloride channel [Phytophthora infestans]